MGTFEKISFGLKKTVVKNDESTTMRIKKHMFNLLDIILKNEWFKETMIN